MANDVFKQYLRAGMTGGTTGEIDLLAATVRAVLYDEESGVLDLDTDATLDDLTGIDIIATSGPLLSKTFVGIVFDAADIAIAGVTGDTFENVLLTVEPNAGANNGNTRLVARIDTGTGLPFNPSGGSVNIVWNASGIFSL